VPDLDQLRDIGNRVRRPAFEEIVATRRRRTLQNRVAAASVASVAAIAVASALLAHGGGTTSELPPVGPSETPTVPSTGPRAVEAPSGQQTITADIAPGDVRGFDALATVANTQPEHIGETYLETTVTAHTDTETVVYDCRAHDVPTWIAYASGDLVSDSPGGAADGWTFQACGSDEPLSFGLTDDLTEPAIRLGMEQKTVRMYALAVPSASQQECLLHTPSECVSPAPIDATDAEFGFRIYEHAPAPLVLQLLDAGNGEPYGFEALGVVDGTAWLVDQAVIAAPHSDRLVVDLPASDEERLVDVYDSRGPGFAGCVDDHADELPPESPDRVTYDAAVSEVCGTTLRLTVDGTPVTPARDPYASGRFRPLGARLAPGVDHQIVVEVAHGDPHDVSYAVVLRDRTEIP
jgi:hypothetical protein